MSAHCAEARLKSMNEPEELAWGAADDSVLVARRLVRLPHNERIVEARRLAAHADLHPAERPFVNSVLELANKMLARRVETTESFELYEVVGKTEEHGASEG
jgi:hypothetical protein